MGRRISIQCFLSYFYGFLISKFGCSGSAALWMEGVIGIPIPDGIFFQEWFATPYKKQSTKCARRDQLILQWNLPSLCTYMVMIPVRARQNLKF